MKKIFVAFVLAAMVCAFGGGENLLKNPTLKAVEPGNIPPWRLIHGTVTEKDGFAELVPADDKGVLAFQLLNPAPDKDYLLEYEISSPNGAVGKVYSEGVWPDKDGKDSYHGFATQNRNLSEKWEKGAAAVRLSPGWKRFYIAITSKNNGIIRIRNLRFYPATKVQQAMGGTWNVSSPHRLAGESLITGGSSMWTNGISIPPPVIAGIPVKPGKEYKIEYRAEGLGPSGNASSSMHVFGTAIKPEFEGGVHFLDLPESEAQNKFHRFRVPDGVKKIDLAVLMTTPGPVKFSGFSLLELPDDPTAEWRLELRSPAYRGIFFGAKELPVAGKIIAPGAESAEVELAGIGKTKVKLVNGTGDFSLTGKLPFGKHLLRCRIFGSGSKFNAIREVELQKVPERSAQVTVADDRTLIVNGKNFFPILFWFGGEKPFDPDQLAFFAANGVNALLATPWEPRRRPEVYLDMLNRASKHGISLFMGFGRPRTMTEVPKYIAEIKRLYPEAVRNHPNFLGYFLVDEPLWSGLPAEPFQAVYKFLREFDPYHPVWINAAPRYGIGDLRPYAEACDIYGVDIYPVPWPNNHSGLEDKNPSCVGKYAIRMREVTRNLKPVIITEQAFAWHECGDAASAARPYPTPAELRFMALDAVVNGGTGYALWGFRHIRDVKFIDNLMVACREMHQLSALFADGKQLPDLTGSAFRIAVYEWNAKKYYVALNPTAEKRNGQIKLDVKEVKFYLENRSVKLSAGSLPLSLEPYCATVFGTEPLPVPAKNLSEWNRENPFRQDCEERASRAKNIGYSGSASWIWDGSAFQKGGVCRVAKRFFVSDSSQEAELWIAVDDEANVFINGLAVREVKGCLDMYKINLRKYLRHGENLLVVEAADAGALPCGVLAELKIGKTSLASDSSWKALPRSGAIPSNVKNYDDLSAVRVVASYGSGAWGRKVKMIEEFSR